MLITACHSVLCIFGGDAGSTGELGGGGVFTVRTSTILTVLLKVQLIFEHVISHLHIPSLSKRTLLPLPGPFDMTQFRNLEYATSSLQAAFVPAPWPRYLSAQHTGFPANLNSPPLARIPRPYHHAQTSA